VIGRAGKHKVRGRESLLEIARDFRLGYREIVSANQGLDPYVPGDGSSVILPTVWVLPEPIPDRGLVVNLSEKRLYLFYELAGRNLVKTFPLGIGDDDAGTPLGNFRITDKITNPSWSVPPSIRKERPHLPAVVEPGPDNPLGSHALRLSETSYFIHGTNRPWSIGRKATLGCIRLYPEDIPELYRLVEPGAEVSIIRQPVKVGMREERIYIEVHGDDGLDIDYFAKARELLENRGLFGKVRLETLEQALAEKSGMPVDISRLSK
jgi:L,D-transpeptidase ErfK/SrfK